MCNFVALFIRSNYNGDDDDSDNNKCLLYLSRPVLSLRWWMKMVHKQTKFRAQNFEIVINNVDTLRH